MSGSEKAASRGSLWTRTSVTAAVVIVLIGIWLGYPHPTLDMDGEILKLANDYMELATPSETPLEGIKVVVTGATSGIGLALTQRLVELGATVVAWGRSERKLEELKNRFDGVVTVSADFDDLASVSQSANWMLKEFSSIDVLINNAGMHYGNGASWNSTISKQGYDRVFTSKYQRFNSLQLVH